MSEGGGRGGGEVWDPKIGVPKMARHDFPACKVRLFPRWAGFQLLGGGKGFDRAPWLDPPHPQKGLT